MTTSHAFTGDLSAIVGADPRSLVVTIDHNAVDADGRRMPLVDLDANLVLLYGSMRITLSGPTTFATTLIDSGAVGTNVPAGTLRYTLTVRWIDGVGTQQTWTLRNFEILGDLDLSDAVGTADPPAIVANEYLTQMQALVDEAGEITGLTGEDAAVALLVNTPASDTATALSAAIGTQITDAVGAEVPPAVAAALATDDAPAAAAALAVETAVENLDLTPAVEAVTLGRGIWVGATEWQSISGAPELIPNGGFPAWRLQPSLTEVVAAFVSLTGDLPDAVDIDLVWANYTATAGTVQLQTRWTAPLVGGSNMASPTETTRALTTTAGGQRLMRFANAGKGVSLSGGLVRLSVRTTGTGTLGANDVLFLGAIIRPSARLPVARETLTDLPGTLSGSQRYNVTAFTRDNVVTDGDDQYAVWINNTAKAIIGKRTRTAGVWGSWTTTDLSALVGAPLGSGTGADGHNNYCLGVDPSGHIHVSGNHHDTALRIIRSTNPGDITAWAVPNVTGIPEANRNSITYPQFITDASGELWLWLRQGGSGTGAMFLNKWDNTGSVWNHVSRPLSGFTIDGNDPDESPYVNTPVVGADGIWHLFFMWRLTDDLATTHDFGYMRSTDATGVAWETADGTALDSITNVAESAACMIFTGFADQINQNGAGVDSAGRPHAVMWIRSPATSGPSYLRHYWHDGTAWHQDDEIVAAGASPNFRSRVVLAAYGSKVFAIYADFPVVGIEGAGSPRTFSRWWLHDVTVGDVARLRPFIFHEEDLGYCELTYDWRALAADGDLHMLACRVVEGDAGHNSVPGKIISLDLADLIANPPA